MEGPALGSSRDYRRVVGLRASIRPAQRLSVPILGETPSRCEKSDFEQKASFRALRRVYVWVWVWVWWMCVCHVIVLRKDHLFFRLLFKFSGTDGNQNG